MRNKNLYKLPLPPTHFCHLNHPHSNMASAAYFNQGYGFQPTYNQMGYPYTGQILQGQEWILLQYLSLILAHSLTCRIPGLIRPYYVHTPTCLVYEYPAATNMPLGLYSMSNGVLTLYPNRYSNPYGSGYRTMPLDNQYSSSAFGMKYPPTMALSNDIAYASPYYGASDYSNPYGYRYGSYGRGYSNVGFM
jgi:hypothetical protein